MEKTLDEVLESGFDSEVEIIEERDNLSWSISSKIKLRTVRQKRDSWNSNWKSRPCSSKPYRLK